MKNLSLILNAILLVAVAILYYLHFDSVKKSAPKITAVGDTLQPLPPTLKTDESDVPQSGVVYVNTDTLLKYYDYYKAAKKGLEAKTKRIQSGLEAKAGALQGEIVTFQQKAQSGGISQEEGMKTEQELMRKQQEFLQAKDAQMAALVNEEQGLSEELNKKVQNYLKRFSSGKQYQFILGYTGLSSNILYKNDSLDITGVVLQGLNDEYRTKK